MKTQEEEPFVLIKKNIVGVDLRVPARLSASALAGPGWTRGYNTRLRV